MVRMTWLLLAFIHSPICFANANVSEVHDEIDRTVWSVFQSAFERLDGASLNSVYADDVLRVTPDGLDTVGEFKRYNLTRFDANKARGESIALDFWFDSRRTQANVSYDVGFYRVGVTNSAGETSYFYGQFHIVLKKLDGQWKIVQDWDTGTIGGDPITAADFARQTPIQF